MFQTQEIADGALKRIHIEEQVRAHIVSGKLAPGKRLPIRRDLEAHFGVSSVTVQLALDRLTEDGFIKAKGRLGTYVSEYPPHLCRYALCFPGLPSDGDNWSRFWTALSNEALRLQSVQPRRMTVFHGVDGHADGEAEKLLLADIRAHRLAGIIFATHPWSLSHSPLLTEPGPPRVAIMDEPVFEGVTAVGMDHEAFITKALDYLAACGRKRIAIITVPYRYATDAAVFTSGFAARGMVTRPYWTQLVAPSDPVCAKNAVHMLMQGPAKRRPDGLIITDDNLVEHATAGLVAAGVRVPEDADVVGHCNFPWPTPSVLPVKRLGYDARQVLQACLDSIDRQQRGEKPVQAVVSPVFEEEVQGLLSVVGHERPSGQLRR